MTNPLHHVALAATLIFGPVGAASAHAHLRTANPTADSLVTTPSELRLGFAEGVNPTCE